MGGERWGKVYRGGVNCVSSNDEEFARTRGEKVIAGLDRWIQNYFDLSLQKENFFLNPEVANQWPADKSG